VKVIVNSQNNLLEQAQAARDSANWSLLIQCIQQLLPGQEVPTENKRQKVTVPVLESGMTTLSTYELEKILELAVDALIAGDFHQRWDVAKVFPKLGASAIGGLIEILEDEDTEEELCWYVARILGEFNQPEAIAALVELLKTSDNEELSVMAAAALGQIGRPAVAALAELLAEEDTRLLAVRSLSQMRRSETITPLLSVVQDAQVSVRAAAIEALSSFHDSRVPPVLLNALHDLAAPVRREAVVGLSFRADLQQELHLVDQLIPRLHDFNLDVCCAAGIALGRLGTDDAAAALYQVLQSPHTPVALQIEIVRALSRLETAVGLEYLRSCLQQLPISVWQETISVLGRVEQPHLTAQAAEIIIEALESDHAAMQQESVKQAIALSLGQLGEVQAVDKLIALLADADMGVKLHAIAALKQLAPEAAHQQLQKLASEALSPDLQQGVAIALQEWGGNVIV